MAFSRRHILKWAVAGTVASGLAPKASFLECLRAKSLPIKLGVTDWNLKQECKLEAVGLAKKIGFDGVEISIGKGTEKLPLSNPDLQHQYVGESKKHNLPIASTCLDNVRILDRVKSKAVLVYYDIGNSTQGGFDILKEIRWLGKERICEFHIKDNPNFLGKGPINIPAVVEAIAQIGFSGWAHLETDCPTDSVEADIATNLKYLRALVRHA